MINQLIFSREATLSVSIAVYCEAIIHLLCAMFLTVTLQVTKSFERFCMAVCYIANKVLVRFSF
jgi:hypothetical protein